MRNNSKTRFYLAIAFAVIVIPLFLFTIKLGSEIGGSIGSLIMTVSLIFIVLILVALALTYYLFFRKVI